MDEKGTEVKLGLGTHHLKDYRIVEEAYNLGIRHFDTAGVYRFGLAERILGIVLKDVSDVVIATKVGQHWEAEDIPFRKRWRFNRYGRFADWRETFLRDAYQRSLDRLKRDSVDILYLHNPPLSKVYPFHGYGAKRIGFSVNKEWHVVPATRHGVCQCPPEWMLGEETYVVREPLGRGRFRGEARKRLEALRDDPRAEVVLVGTNDINHLRENAAIFC